MSSNVLFVGDLPPECSAEQIQQIFAQYGTVTDFKGIPPKMPGQKACAIIHYASPDEAKWLVENLNGNVPQGLQTSVVVRFKDQSGGGGKGGGSQPFLQGPPPVESFSAPGGGGGKGGNHSPNETVFIGDLPLDINDATLQGVFSAYGTVISVKALPPKPGATNGCGLVQFATRDEAQWLVDNVNGNIPEGLAAPVVVKFKQQSAGKGAAGPIGGNDWGQLGFGKGGGADWGKGGDYGGPYSSPKGGDKGGKKGKKGGPSSVDAVGMVKALGGKGAPSPVENQLCIRGLPWNCTDLHLYQVFSQYGAIPPKGVKAMLDPEGNCTGLGFVDFSDSSAAQLAAMSLHESPMPDGTSLQVTQKRDNGGKGGDKGKKNGKGAESWGQEAW